jgi:hypothetical protein
MGTTRSSLMAESVVLPHEDWDNHDKHMKGACTYQPEGSRSRSTDVLGQSTPWLPLLSVGEIPACWDWVCRGTEFGFPSA